MSKFSNMFRPMSTLKDEELYCSECDGIVKSKDVSTGKFFIVSGHKWDVRHQKTTDEYDAVIFALCTECLQKTGFLEMCGENDELDDGLRW